MDFLTAHNLLADVTVSQNAQDFADQAMTASAAIHTAIDNLWTSIYQGGTYKGLCKLGAQIAIGSMAFYVFAWYKRTLEDNHFDWGRLTDFIWPMCVVALLVSSPGNADGARLWNVTSFIRNSIQYADQQVLGSASSTANLAQSRQAAAQNVAFEEGIKAIATQCNGQATQALKQQCWNNNRSHVHQLNNPEQPNPWLDGLKTIFNDAAELATDPGQAAIDAATQATNIYEAGITSVIKGFVLACSIAFSWLLEISLLLTAMLGPLSVGASLLPLPTKPILAWITTMYSIGIAKISFDIMTGLISDVLLNAPPSDAMAYIIFTGILAPILALALAGGGGMAVFSGLTASAAAAVGGVGMANSAAKSKQASKQAAQQEAARHQELVNAARA